MASWKTQAAHKGTRSRSSHWILRPDPVMIGGRSIVATRSSALCANMSVSRMSQTVATMDVLRAAGGQRHCGVPTGTVISPAQLTALRRPSSWFTCATRLRIDCDDALNLRASWSGLRPDRASRASVAGGPAGTLACRCKSFAMEQDWTWTRTDLRPNLPPYVLATVLARPQALPAGRIQPRRGETESSDTGREALKA